MEHKGMVIALTKKRALVSTRDFECFYINRTPTLYVGKEIDFSENAIIKDKPFLTKLLTVASCIAILLVFSVFLNNMNLANKWNFINTPKVFAYVGIDINPSIEMEIDKVGNVINFIPLNNDAKRIYKNINVEKTSVSKAITEILSEFKKNTTTNNSDKDLLLLSSTLNNKSDEFSKDYMSQQERLNNLMASVQTDLQQNMKTSVYLYKANINERNLAKKEGISTGRYILYKNSVKSNGNISIEDAKNLNVRELIKHVLNTNTINNHSNTNKPSPLTTLNSDTKQNASTQTPNINDSNNINQFSQKPTLFTSSNLPTVSNSSTINKNAVNTPTQKTTVSRNTPAPNVFTTQTSIPSKSTIMRFESYNYTGYYIRHQSFGGYISSYVNPIDDSVFYVVPGLSDPNSISFESTNYPGGYLIQEDFKIVLRKYESSKSYKESATFKKVPGLADKKLVSFQSISYPKRYIRHANFKLELTEIDTDLGKKDATFKEIIYK